MVQKLLEAAETRKKGRGLDRVSHSSQMVCTSCVSSLNMCASVTCELIEGVSSWVFATCPYKLMDGSHR